MTSDLASAGIRELAPTGRLRAGVNVGNTAVVRIDPDTGKLSGRSIDTFEAIGAALGLPVDYVIYQSAGQVVAAAHDEAWDIASLAVDPAREGVLAFSAPYARLEAAFVVPAHSSLADADEVDRLGVRIAVAVGAAYANHLERTVRRARLMTAETPHGAQIWFETEGLEALAGITTGLESFVSGRPGFRMLPGRFLTIEHAIAVSRSRPLAAELVQAAMLDILSCQLDMTLTDGKARVP